MLLRDIFGLCALAAISWTPAFAAESGELMPLHETRWSIDGKPILGTYTFGADKLDDLRLVHDAEMNVVIGGEEELDPQTPEGAYCLENKIKVMLHLTKFLYHGVKLRDEITPDQTTIPLYYARKPATHESQIIQLDDELIRYESMTDEGLVNCQRGYNGTKAAAHREGVILFWPESCAAEIERFRSSPNLYGYYVLDDSPGNAVSALRALYRTVQRVDPGGVHPVCAGFGDAGSLVNLQPGVCDMMLIYWYPVSTARYDRERTSDEVQRMLTAARARVPGIPFAGVYQAFDGRPGQTGQGLPTGDQLREQFEDFVREGASGLIAFLCRGGGLPGWGDLPELQSTVKQANHEIQVDGGLRIRPETEAMAQKRIQPKGFWETPQAVLGVVPAWQLVGPFEDKEGKGLDAAFPPDDGFDPNGVYPGKFGSIRWRAWETTCGLLGFSNLFGDHSALHQCVEYAYCEVTSPTEQTVQMRLCTDDDAWARLNGKEVYRFEGPRGIDYDKEVVPVTLPAGTSRIEVKVYNRAGMWGLFMRFTAMDGTPLQGLQFSPAGQG